MPLTARRNVYPESELYRLWAHGVPAGRTIRNASGNVRVEGDTIYSYGSHFPMAQRVEVAGTITVGTQGRKGKRPTRRDVPGNVVAYLYTTRTYSVTTAGHLCATRGAMRNNGRVFHIDPWDSAHRSLWEPLTNRKGSARPVAEWFQARINAAAADAAAPRIRAGTRLAHLDKVDALIAEWREVHSFFRVRLAVDTVKVPASVSETRAKFADAFTAHTTRMADAARVKAERERLENAAAAERSARALPLVDRFRKGETSPTMPDPAFPDARALSIRDIHYPVLRIVAGIGSPVPEEVETSWGARIPVEDARKALRMLPRLLARMGQRDESESIGHYRGASAGPDALRVGCHTIPWAEVRAFCAYYGWECPALPVAA